MNAVLKKFFKNLFLILINFYQVHLSGFFGGNCRFTPTCSEYAKDAFESHGPFSALRLTIKRILRCHPFGQYGYDPVPHMGCKGKIDVNGQ